MSHRFEVLVTLDLTGASTSLSLSCLSLYIIPLPASLLVAGKAGSPCTHEKVQPYIPLVVLAINIVS